MALDVATVQPSDLARLSYRRIGAIDGLPRRWQDGVATPGYRLQKAIWAYLEQHATPDDCAWVLAWIGYYLAAPCWLDAPDVSGLAEEIRRLRERARATPPEPQAIQELIWACLEVGIDPL